MEFVKRPVEPYLVPVEEFTVPEAAGPVVLARAAPPPRPPSPARTAARRAARRGRALAAASWSCSGSPRAARRLRRLAAYLDDPDPKVRRAAVATLTEVAPDGVAAALASALGDAHGRSAVTRRRALRELVEVLPATGEVRAASARARRRGRGRARRRPGRPARARARRGETFADALDDGDHRVRLQAVRGLVALDAAGLVARGGRRPLPRGAGGGGARARH